MTKILFVDDEKDLSKITIRVIQEHKKDFSVTPAYTGKEALTLLQEQKFDLAIIDLILPDMNGSQIIAFIRHNQKIKDMPIIVSSGISDDFTAKTCQELGADGFLSKPYQFQEDMLPAIERCLGSTA